ncbi:MAG: hypothetical protein K2H01_00565 [Ruminococcus sp.]|nr:hypothetical protein [Ruminococcus sp.]
MNSDNVKVYFSEVSCNDDSWIEVQLNIPGSQSQTFEIDNLEQLEMIGSKIAEYISRRKKIKLPDPDDNSIAAEENISYGN